MESLVTSRKVKQVKDNDDTNVVASSVRLTFLATFLEKMLRLAGDREVETIEKVSARWIFTRLIITGIEWIEFKVII